MTASPRRGRGGKDPRPRESSFAADFHLISARSARGRHSLGCAGERTFRSSPADAFQGATAEVHRAVLASGAVLASLERLWRRPGRRHRGRGARQGRAVGTGSADAFHRAAAQVHRAGIAGSCVRTCGDRFWRRCMPRRTAGALGQGARRTGERQGQHRRPQNRTCHSSSSSCCGAPLRRSPPKTGERAHALADVSRGAR
jgi:hypothetical protein